ncbi:hypothetical protein SO694_00057032 [Aureococcus anophagefferens]|uniref:Uncharacterized protein n=1 Tax=Aureococcus anophagefferens TaxID=44056 RepID=A0ABR1FX12_AURAN
MLNHSSSMFSNITLDRWGRPIKPKTSPRSRRAGWYDVDVQIAPPPPSGHPRKTALSSAFVSGTRRRLHSSSNKTHAGPGLLQARAPRPSPSSSTRSARWI